MLKSPNFLYSCRQPKKEWYGTFIVQCICKSGRIVICDNVMWYTKVEKSNLKVEELQGRPWGGANNSIELSLPNFGAQNIFLIQNALKMLIYTHSIVSLTQLKACPSGNAW